jgi:hypothetical protein
VAKVVNREFLILRYFKWILKRSNALCNGGKNMSLSSPLLGFLLDKY